MLWGDDDSTRSTSSKKERGEAVSAGGVESYEGIAEMFGVIFEMSFVQLAVVAAVFSLSTFLVAYGPSAYYHGSLFHETHRRVRTEYPPLRHHVGMQSESMPDTGVVPQGGREQRSEGDRPSEGIPLTAENIGVPSPNPDCSMENDNQVECGRKQRAN